MADSAVKKTILGIGCLLIGILVGNRWQALWQINRSFVELATAGVGANSSWASAEEQLRSAQAALPDSIRIRQGLGQLYFFQGRFQEAIPWLEVSLAASPLDPVAGLFLGQAWWKLNQPERAISVWQQVGAGAYFVAQGRNLMQQEQWRDALDNLQLGMALGEVSPETHFEVGKALVGNGRFAEAISELNQALMAEGATTVREVYFWLGRAYDESNHPDEALRAYQAAYARSSPESYVAYYVGKLLYEQQRYAEAKDYLVIGTQATDLALGHYMLGRVYAFEQDWQRAIAELKWAIEKQPENAAFHESLGEVYLQQGEKRTGLQEYHLAYCLSAPSSSIQLRSSQVLQRLASGLMDCSN